MLLITPLLTELFMVPCMRVNYVIIQGIAIMQQILNNGHYRAVYTYYNCRLKRHKWDFKIQASLRVPCLASSLLCVNFCQSETQQHGVCWLEYSKNIKIGISIIFPYLETMCCFVSTTIFEPSFGLKLVKPVQTQIHVNRLETESFLLSRWWR